MSGGKLSQIQQTADYYWKINLVSPWQICPTCSHCFISSAEGTAFLYNTVYLNVKKTCFVLFFCFQFCQKKKTQQKKKPTHFPSLKMDVVERILTAVAKKRKKSQHLKTLWEMCWDVRKKLYSSSMVFCMCTCDCKQMTWSLQFYIFIGCTAPNFITAAVLLQFR